MTKMSQRSLSELAKSFLMLVVSGKVREAYAKYIDQEFIHHNPYFKGDRDSLLLAMEEDAIKNPGKRWYVMNHAT